MKEIKGKKSRLSSKKTKQNDALNDTDGDKAEVFKEDTNSGNESDGSTTSKRQGKEVRRSGRKSERKCMADISSSDEDKDEDRNEEEEADAVRKSHGKQSKSKKYKKSKNELNGDKVQMLRKDQKWPNKKFDHKAGSSESENEQGSEEKEEERTSEKLQRKSFKRSSLALKGTEVKNSKFKNNEPEETEKDADETENSAKLKKTENKKLKLSLSKGKKRDNSDGNDDDVNETTEEYEVEKLVDVYFKKNGEKEFLVRWKGYSSKDDTWEPEKHLNCQELIDAFLEKCEKAKNVPLRELRADRRKTDRYSVHQQMKGRKLSPRLKHKPRKTYYEVE